MVPVQREWMVMRMLFAEFIGTYALVFAGTGAIVINDITGGAISHAGIALTFGLVVMAMISAVGDISGAHFNPAVTLAFASGGRFPWRDVPAYALSQFLGGGSGKPYTAMAASCTREHGSNPAGALFSQDICV